MRSFTVAVVAACPFPANHGTPGAIREMSEALAALGHSVHVVTYPLKDDIPIKGVIIHRVRQVGQKHKIVVGPSYQRLIFDALMVSKLYKIIKRHKVDIIHGFNYEGALVGYIAKKFTGVPMLYNAINTMINELPTYNFIRPKTVAIGMANFLDTVVPRMADFIMADTEEIQSFILKKGISPDRIIVVPSGVNVEMFEGREGKKVREDYEIGEKPLVIYTGTFDQFQGVDHLLKAFQIVHRECPDAILLLLGSTLNPLHVTKYQQMARDLGIEKSLIITSSTLDHLPDFLAAADIAVVPRISSPGIPTKLLNYMAAGKPIVSFEGSAKGLSHMVNALVVESDDWKKFGDNILRLINDKSLSKKLGLNARESITGKLDWNTIVLTIEKIYASILKKNNVKKELFYKL